MIWFSGVDSYLITVLQEIFSMLDLMHKLAQLFFNADVMHSPKNTKENRAPI